MALKLVDLLTNLKNEVSYSRLLAFAKQFSNLLYIRSYCPPSALISTLSSANANILGSSEIMVRLAASKQVPTVLGHMRRGHPYVSVFAGATLYLLLIVSGQTQTVIELANVTAIAALIVVNITAAKALASRTHTGLRLPLGWTVPMLGAFGAFVQFIFIPFSSVLLGLALAVSGVLAYVLRQRYHMPRLHLQITKAIDNTQGPLGRRLRR
jgi:APA family basic amino acid/polyamine antiporter